MFFHYMYFWYNFEKYFPTSLSNTRGNTCTVHVPVQHVCAVFEYRHDAVILLYDEMSCLLNKHVCVLIQGSVLYCNTVMLCSNTNIMMMYGQWLSTGYVIPLKLILYIQIYNFDLLSYCTTYCSLLSVTNEASKIQIMNTYYLQYTNIILHRYNIMLL